MLSFKDNLLSSLACRLLYLSSGTGKEEMEASFLDLCILSKNSDDQIYIYLCKYFLSCYILFILCFKLF